MPTRSRTSRRTDAFDQKLDAAITSLLLGSGFAEAQPYVFRRQTAEGNDLIYFDVAGASFFVHMSFKPRYMEEIDDLFEHLLLPGQPNIGGSSYLTPKRMTHRPREYYCNTAASRDRSLEAVADGLRTHALAWLETLRDPVRYIDAVSPASSMYFGRANEVAGQLHAARVSYDAQMRSILECFEMLPFNKFLGFEGCREFVYLCLKLRRDLDKCERVMQATGYRPQVTPLPDAV